MKIKKCLPAGEAGKLKQNFGFTIIDLLVSMAIMTLLTLTSIISFRQAERNQNLNNAAEILASQIRELENMAITGKEAQAGQVPAGGYGIHFEKTVENIFYFFFADMDRDLLYKTSIPADLVPYFSTSDREIELKKKYSPHPDIIISEININGLPVNWGETLSLDIVFKTPNAKVYVNGETKINFVLINYVSIALKHTKIDKTKTIKIYPLSRQISVE
ncbi:MAG: hypothetical protein V1892_03115 [bacterium]